MHPDQILRESELRALDGLGHTRRWDYIAAGIYPKPFRLSDGGRAKGWFGREIAAWQAWRKARRDGTAPEGSTWKDFLVEGGDDDPPQAGPHYAGLP
jgi:predicted DNA-binding transcriptional regulator AlpA